MTSASVDTPVATAAPTNWLYPVRVVEKNTGAAIPVVGAQVTIEIAGRAPRRKITDVDGFARLAMPAHPGAAAVLRITAAGYESYRRETDLYPDQLPETVELTPINNTPTESADTPPPPPATDTPLAAMAVASPAETVAVTGTPTATPSLASPAQSFPVYETFDGDVALNWESAFGEWGIINDRLMVQRFNNGDPAVVLLPHPAQSAYTIQMDVGTFQHVDDSGDVNVPFSYFQVLVNAQENADGYSFVITNGGVGCNLHEKGNQISMMERRGPGSEMLNLLTRKYTGDHTIEIVVRGDRYEFFVNGNSVCSFRDDTFTEGVLAVAVHQGASGRMWIDNVHIAVQE